MPTSKHGKVRHMLKDGRAVIVKKNPFTIQLTYDTTEYIQPVTLGVKPGYNQIAVSASTEKKELYSAIQELRTDIPSKIQSRRELRRTRRGRLRYRKPRFNNRVRTKKKGWLAPSVTQKVDNQVKVCTDLKKILPIKTARVQIASYDVQKIINPEITGVEYTEGSIDLWNIREYVFARDKYKCRCCKGKSKDQILGVHHVMNYLDKLAVTKDPAKRAALYKKHYSPANTITICKTCHEQVNAGSLECKVRVGSNCKKEAFENITKWNVFNRLSQEFEQCQFTFGYITKNIRIENNLPSFPTINALCIAGNPKAEILSTYRYQKKLRCHNRQINRINKLKGGAYKKCQSPKYILNFKLYDKVEYQGQVCFINIRNRKGRVGLKTLDGTIIHSSARVEDIKLLERASSVVTEIRDINGYRI